MVIDPEGKKHNGAIRSPVFPVVTNIYVENFESKARQSFSGDMLLTPSW